MLFKFLIGPSKAKHLMSDLVCYLSSTLDLSTTKIKEAWEDKLGIVIEDETWDEILTVSLA